MNFAGRSSWLPKALAASAVMIALLAGAAHAQPSDRPDGPPPAGDRPPPRDGDRPGPGGGEAGGAKRVRDRIADRMNDRNSPPDAKLMKTALQRMLERTKAAQAKLEEAIAGLDKGEAPAKIRDELDRARNELGVGPFAMAEGFGGMGGGPGGPGGPDDRPPPEEGAQRGPGGGGGLGAGGPSRPLSNEDREEIRLIIAKHRPEVGARLEELKQRSPRMYEQLFDRAGRRLGDIRRLERDDPAMFELKLDEAVGTWSAMRLMGDYHRAMQERKPAEELETLKAELRSVLEKQFDTRLRLQQRQLDDLSQRSGKLKAELDRLATDRAKMIDAKLSEMIKGFGEGRGPGKGGPGGPPPEPRDP